MKNLLYKSLSGLLTFAILTFSVSCEDLTEVNTSPDQLDAVQINLKYVLTYAITHGATDYESGFVYGNASNTMAAMQYMQRDYIGFAGDNTFNWSGISISDKIASLSNANHLLKNAEKDPVENNKVFYKAVGLTIRSLYFGLFTSSWGDIPYSEAFKAEENNFTPVYDEQKSVFAGILKELEEANTLFGKISSTTGLSSADVMYGGNPKLWQKFCNVLRLRFLMRLSEKASEFSDVNIKNEFANIVGNAEANPLFNSSTENAAFEYAGGIKDNCWPGGPIYWSNRSEFYRRKPCKTFVDQLRNSKDPRLTVFIRPVDVFIKYDPTCTPSITLENNQVVRHTNKMKDVYGNIFDTAKYVGLPAALVNPDNWNNNNSNDYPTIKSLKSSIYVDEGSNPSNSYFADKYQQDTHKLVKVVYASYAEQCFLLAEAQLRGWISGSPIDNYIKGIEGHLSQYGIENGSKTVYNPTTHEIIAFDKSSFLAERKTEIEKANDKMLCIMTQKWIATFMTPEFWYDWFRTGLPKFTDNLNNGTSKIPLRMIYGDDEIVANEKNVKAAIDKLSNKTNDQWGRMWLLQGTNKPYAN